MPESTTPTPYRHELWQFFHDNHGLTLLESELEDIAQAVNRQLGVEKSELLNENNHLLSDNKQLRDCLLRARVILQENIEDLPAEATAREVSIRDEIDRLIPYTPTPKTNAS